ncbi:hypothetical protein SAMN04487914_1552 [Arthrobacter sp. ok909]|jgi:hypothetical protein|nr:hypothetical protein SAMN04487914_1552 [Arthrobacter sp. ok909]
MVYRQPLNLKRGIRPMRHDLPESYMNVVPESPYVRGVQK